MYLLAYAIALTALIVILELFMSQLNFAVFLESFAQLIIYFHDTRLGHLNYLSPKHNTNHVTEFSRCNT